MSAAGPGRSEKGLSACVAGGVLCVSCGYDLRGLTVEASCPECGTPAERSLQGDQLSGADERWLRRITLGQRILAWGWLLMLMVPGATIALIILSVANRRLEQYFEFAFGIILIVCGVGGLTLTVAGILFVTIQDPRETLQESMFSVRRLSRIGMVTAAALYIQGLLLNAVISEAAEIARPIFLLGALVLFTLGIVASLRWLATLLNRVPVPAQAKEATQMANFLRWGLPLAVLLVAVYQSPGRVPAAGRQSPYEYFALIAGCTGSVLMLILIAKCIAAAILFFAAARAFRMCLARASVKAEMKPLVLSSRSSAVQRV